MASKFKGTHTLPCFLLGYALSFLYQLFCIFSTLLKP